jgi:hypothetical protein
LIFKLKLFRLQIKLDTYRADSKSGRELNDDQKAAVSKYGEVEACLEMMKESAKQVATMHQDNVKLQKKLARRETLERHQADTIRLKTKIIMQEVFRQLGCEGNVDHFLF